MVFSELIVQPSQFDLKRKIVEYVMLTINKPMRTLAIRGKYILQSASILF
jgi:hypothetical protein